MRGEVWRVCAVSVEGRAGGECRRRGKMARAGDRLGRAARSISCPKCCHCTGRSACAGWVARVQHFNPSPFPTNVSDSFHWFQLVQEADRSPRRVRPHFYDMPNLRTIHIYHVHSYRSGQDAESRNLGQIISAISEGIWEQNFETSTRPYLCHDDSECDSDVAQQPRFGASFFDCPGPLTRCIRAVYL